MFIALHVLMIRTAISPRLAMSILWIVMLMCNGWGSNSLLDWNQQLIFLDGVGFLHMDVLDGAILWRLDWNFHLHGFDDDEGVPRLNPLTWLDQDFPNGSGYLCIDIDGGHWTLQIANHFTFSPLTKRSKLVNMVDNIITIFKLDGLKASKIKRKWFASFVVASQKRVSL